MLIVCMSNRFTVVFRLLSSDRKIKKTVARIVGCFTLYKITTLTETRVFTRHIITCYIFVRPALLRNYIFNTGIFRNDKTFVQSLVKINAVF